MMVASIFHPALRRLPPEQRAAAVREARRTPFDILELVGMAAGLITGSLLIRGNLGDGLLGIAISAGVIGFFVARRTRRDLSRLMSRE